MPGHFTNATATRGLVINRMRFDPATVEFVSGHPGGDVHFAPEDFRRFNEHLFKTPEGYFFMERPLARDEAEAWLIAHGDEPLARQCFPDDED